MKSYRSLFILLTLLMAMGCNTCSHRKAKTIVLVEKPEQINEEVNKLLVEQLTNTDTSKTIVIAKDTLFATNFILRFYQQNKFNIIWTDKGQLTKQGDTLFSILKNADEYGLIANDYHFSKIDSLLRTKKDSVTKKMNAVKLLEAELLLTDAFFIFAVHASKGRLNKDSLSPEWKGSHLDTAIFCFLISAIEKNDLRSAIDSLEPQNKQYRKLKIALRDFKFEFQNSEWDSLKSKESDSVTFNDRLKKRLIASHDYCSEYPWSDSINLLNAIKNFQCKHNLTEDGKVGKLTFQALQRTKQDYIHQIEMNMERWRLYAEPEEKQFVWINIPKYEMRFIEDDTLVMKSRIIVGQPTKQTPLLKSSIRYFIIYPYWTVPYGIATKELLPVLKRDTSYLRKKNFEVLDAKNKIVDAQTIDWKKYNEKYFPWKLRQRYGDDNSLGVLKFNFENKYGVYMHDTDNHRLFTREMRAMSHGCVRLEKFMDFAQFIIRDDDLGYSLDSLKMDILKEKQKYVYLKRPVPIYIQYFTAEVDSNNELYFFIDVYKRDEKMMKALFKNN